MKWVFPVVAALLFFGIGTLADHLFVNTNDIKKDIFLLVTFYVTFYLLAKLQQHYTIEREN